MLLNKGKNRSHDKLGMTKNTLVFVIVYGKIVNSVLSANEKSKERTRLEDAPEQDLLKKYRILQLNIKLNYPVFSDVLKEPY